MYLLYFLLLTLSIYFLLFLLFLFFFLLLIFYTFYQFSFLFAYKFEKINISTFLQHLVFSTLKNTQTNSLLFLDKTFLTFYTVVKPSIYQYCSASYITTLPPSAYLPVLLSGILLDFSMGNLILRWASHLDAFSVYPFHTQLLSHAIGMTTDTPSVCPSWSSRTKDSSFQISFACDR